MDPDQIFGSSFLRPGHLSPWYVTRLADFSAGLKVIGFSINIISWLIIRFFSIEPRYAWNQLLLKIPDQVSQFHPKPIPGKSQSRFPGFLPELQILRFCQFL
jgi:hypothetical protein